MNKTKILAAVMAAVLALSLTACGSKTPDAPETTTAEDVTEIVLTQAETTAEAAETEIDTTAAEAETEAAATEKAAEETEAATEAETEPEKKAPETKAEIVEFYKNAATETDKGKVQTNAKMEMTALDGGSGVVGGLLNLFKPIAKSALEKNSGTESHITGGYKNLTESDVASATANDDGKYTTIHIKLKDQTDGMNGKSDQGSVGHGVSVLDGLQTALDELNGVDLDTTGGTLKLHYNDAYIDAKIDNATGKIVSGKWHYKVDVTIDNVKAKIGIASATLKGTTGTVERTVTM